MRVSSPLALLLVFVLICGCGVSKSSYKKLGEEKTSVQSRCRALEEEVRLASRNAEELKRRVGRMEKAIARLKAERKEFQERYERQTAESVMQQIEYRELQDEYQAFKGVAADTNSLIGAQAPEERRTPAPSPFP